MDYSRATNFKLKMLFPIIHGFAAKLMVFGMTIGCSFSALGAIQNIEIGGAFYKVDPDKTTGYYTVYAGYNGSAACATRDNSNTCNSCLGQTNLVPCNTKMVYPELRVRIAFQSTATGTNLQVAAKTSAEVIDPSLYNYSPGPIVTGSEAYIELTWSVICQKVLNLDSNCNGSDTAAFSKTGTLTLGLSTSADASSLTESFNVNFVFNFVPQTSAVTFTRCDPGATLTGKVGVCSYSMFPGDGKAYIENVLLDTTSGGLAVTDHGKLGGVAILYAETTSKSDPTPLTRLGSGSPMTTLNVDSDLDASTGGAVGTGAGTSGTTTDTTTSDAVEFERDYISDGLSNGTTYCFLIGNIDNTGNIFNFMDPAMVNSANAPNYCVTPQEVVGLLDGKSCFIATAAFGSPMSKEVQSLRNFRDFFLMKNPIGSTIVQLYYKLSPPFAHFIGQRDVLRFLVRGLLWPFVVFAKLSLKYGLFWTTFLFLTVLSIALILFKVLYRRLQIFFKISLILFCIVSGISFSEEVLAQADVDGGLIQDGPPNEAPYVDTTKEFAPKFESLPKTSEPTESSNQNSIEMRTSPATTSSLIRSPMEPSTEKKSIESSTVESKDGDSALESSLSKKKDVDYITHPLTKRGLEVIEADGTYVYKIKEKTYSKSSTFRIGLMEPPAIRGLDGSSFSDHYSTDRVPMFLYDYEWQPLVGKGKLGVQAGFGLFMAKGSGRFYPIPDTLIPKEKFTFYGLPLNLGFIYRMELGNRQWLAPYVSGGGSYYLLVETRNDKSSAKVAHSPSAYGGGGLLLSLSRVDSKMRFVMLNDYGIGNLWLNFEFRYQQGLNKDVDLSGSIVAFGIQADY